MDCLIFLATALASTSPDEVCCAEPPCSVEPGVVVARGHDHGRRLRSDFETPDALLVAATSEWPTSLAALLAAIDGRVPTILLDESDDDGEVAVWPEADADVVLVSMRFDSGWVRDYGPLQVHTRKGVEWLDAGYYTDRPDDDEVPRRLAPELDAGVSRLPLALEGGGIISNGRGLCASTTMSVERAEIDIDDHAYLDKLLDTLGCRVWALVPPIYSDSTGHVDMMAQFVSANRVVVSSLDAGRFPDEAKALDGAVTVLEAGARALGQKLEVRRVPTVIDAGGHMLTYVNGTRISGAFLVPSYTHAPRALQQRAYRTLKAALGGLTLLPVAADELIDLGGAVHCATLGITLPPPRVASAAGARPRRVGAAAHTTGPAAATTRSRLQRISGRVRAVR